jgi:hypothetical protein
MICPFCKKTIHVEFYGGRWVAMRDGHEHSCIGLVAALAGAERPAKPAGDIPPPQRMPGRNPGAASHVDPKSVRPRKSTKSRQPVQLELQAVD